MLSKFNIILWTRVVQKFCPSLPSEPWQENGSNMELPDKAMNHDARPALHRGISAFRTSVTDTYFFFGHRFNGAVAREPFRRGRFSDCLVAVCSGRSVCVCVCACACAWFPFYPSLSITFPFFFGWSIGIRNLVWIGGAVKDRFTHID